MAQAIENRSRRHLIDLYCDTVEGRRSSEGRSRGGLRVARKPQGAEKFKLYNFKLYNVVTSKRSRAKGTEKGGERDRLVRKERRKGQARKVFALLELKLELVQSVLGSS